MTCKVTIQDESGGANRTDDDLPCAVFSAVDGSGIYTVRAFVIGLIAHAVLEEVFDGDDMQRLKIFLTGVQRPANVAGLVALALS